MTESNIPRAIELSLASISGKTAEHPFKHAIVELNDLGARTYCDRTGSVI